MLQPQIHADVVPSPSLLSFRAVVRNLTLSFRVNSARNLKRLLRLCLRHCFAERLARAVPRAAKTASGVARLVSHKTFSADQGRLLQAGWSVKSDILPKRVICSHHLILAKGERKSSLWFNCPQLEKGIGKALGEGLRGRRMRFRGRHRKRHRQRIREPNREPIKRR